MLAFKQVCPWVKFSPLNINLLQSWALIKSDGFFFFPPLRNNIFVHLCCLRIKGYIWALKNTPTFTDSDKARAKGLLSSWWPAAKIEFKIVSKRIPQWPLNWVKINRSDVLFTKTAGATLTLQSLLEAHPPDGLKWVAWEVFLMAHATSLQDKSRCTQWYLSMNWTERRKKKI